MNLRGAGAIPAETGRTAALTREPDPGHSGVGKDARPVLRPHCSFPFAMRYIFANTGLAALVDCFLVCMKGRF